MIEIKIKPLSVNKVWRGRRFKTPDYEAYEEELWYLLPKGNRPAGKLQLTIEFGFSTKASDVDNCVKPFIDVLQKKYIFNDNMIYKLVVEKKIVPKKQEYIKFKIEKYEDR